MQPPELRRAERIPRDGGGIEQLLALLPGLGHEYSVRQSPSDSELTTALMTTRRHGRRASINVLQAKEVKMDSSFFRKPAAAIGIAVGVGIAAHKANANAARVVGVPVLLFGALLSLLFAAFGFGR